MINVIVSMTTNEDLPKLKTTLSSFTGDSLSISVINSDPQADLLTIQDIINLCPTARIDAYYMNSTLDRELHMNNFYEAMYSITDMNGIITFLRAGDRFLAPHLIPEIEVQFNTSEGILAVRGETTASGNFEIYKNPHMNLQGWFFSKGFLDYYTFLKVFKNEVEFALHLSYIAELQPKFIKYLHEPVVFITSESRDIGATCRHYFNNILPEQTFFDPALGVRFIYDIVCDYYISYIQATNQEVPLDVMQSLLRDISDFYTFFEALELEDLDELLKTYNNKMKEIYNRKKDAFLIKIPNITFIQFLENFNNKEE